MPETRSQQHLQAATATNNIEPYKLSEIFSIVPEFDGDQISLGTFLNACDCANDMAIDNQKLLLVIHIKNKLRGRAAQLINSRNPSSYVEIKRLLNLHFGDSRDLSSLIQDLQRLRQLGGESPITFFNRLQVLNAKMHAFIQKSPDLNNDQKIAQCALIDTMALNTLLTGLEPRLGQVIRAGDPKDLPDAHARIRRELQLSYLETQKTNKPITIKREPNSIIKRPPIQAPKCFSCGRIGHLSHECRSQQFQRPNNFFQNNPMIKKEPNYPAANSQPVQNQNRPMPSQHFQNQTRPSVIQRHPNSPSNQHRAHHFNPDSYEYQSYVDEETYNDFDTYQNYSLTPDYDINEIPVEDFQNFLSLSNQNHPPIEVTQDSNKTLQEVQEQIQTLNLDNMDPNLNFPEQNFL